MSKGVNHRIIARLDIKGPNLVKGVHLEGLRVLGRPEDFARHYYEGGADELIYMDVVASLYERNSLHEIITRTAEQIFIPITVGGGIRTVDDIRAILRAGADKVALNTAVIKNPSLIKEAAEKFGSSTIIVAIETIRQPQGTYLAFTDNGREHTGIEALSWARQVEDLGAGEILLTSVDREGTGEGFDIGLTKSIAEAVDIPVIAHGGPGKLSHIADVIRNGEADAVAVASMIHYDFIKTNVPVLPTEGEGNVEFLISGRDSKRFEPANLRTIKNFLHDSQIECRWEST